MCVNLLGSTAASGVNSKASLDQSESRTLFPDEDSYTPPTPQSQEATSYSARKLELRIPANPNLLPVGHYLLFLVNGRGAVSEGSSLVSGSTSSAGSPHPSTDSAQPLVRRHPKQCPKTVPAEYLQVRSTGFRASTAYSAPWRRWTVAKTRYLGYFEDIRSTVPVVLSGSTDNDHLPIVTDGQSGAKEIVPDGIVAL